MGDKSYTSLVAGDSKDMKVSYEEYNEMLDVLNDDMFSKTGLMRMKNLFEVNSYGMVYVPFYALIPSVATSYLLTGLANRSQSGYRIFFPTLSIIMPIVCWWIYKVQIPRRLYTEIFTDPTADGTYLRSALRNNAPALWARFSSRLAARGYDFPEMHQSRKNTEFPLDFAN